MPGAEQRSATAVAEKATEAQLARQTEIDDLRWLMGDVRGRRFIWRQLSESGIYRSTFTGDALTSAFKEGERNRGLKLMDEITRHCPKSLLDMQKEARSNERRSASTSSKPDAPGR